MWSIIEGHMIDKRIHVKLIGEVVGYQVATNLSKSQCCLPFLCFPKKIVIYNAM